MAGTATGQAPYRSCVAGTPDVLSSPPASAHRRRAALALCLAGVATAVSLVVVSSDGGAGTQGAAPASLTSSAAASSGRSQPTSTTIDPADRITGSLPGPVGLPIGTTAIAAARSVVDSYCDRISSWRLTIDGENGEYRDAVVLLRPAGPAYSDVALQIELTWDTDHYDWAGSRRALESCP